MSRLSFGPNVLRAAYGSMRTLAESILRGDSFENLADGAITHEEMLGYLPDDVRHGE